MVGMWIGCLTSFLLPKHPVSPLVPTLPTMCCSSQLAENRTWPKKLGLGLGMFLP